MSLDKATVRKIGFLARLEIPEEDLEGLAHELNGILGWVEQLQQVNTEGVAPLASVSETRLYWRDDVVTDGAMPEKVLANAPDGLDGYFLVPKVVE
ncbi:Asp-tRNA(Asn)/Glu-tRNA(Gln) amidotransferase subunit GatC [Oleispirillum naphthae]|uniref:Asp-tRNA(Asn)/Glu-tRNA(Gln) amidotransferase subunit GatC n=1 Tax=Oleispirillum naphthae TaxID=2838853 RepID=UPI0030824A76